MKIITFDDIINTNIDLKQCYRWVEEALLGKHDAMLPAKISLKPGEGMFYNTMPVLLPPIERGGVKLVTRYPDRVPSLQAQILLYDLATGNNIALMDGTWITTMRTGAVAAHSIKLLAVENFNEIGMIGLGNTARATLSILLALYPERCFHIKLKKYKGQHIDFEKRFSSYENVCFSYCDTYEETIEGSDVIISCATYFGHDICPDKYFKEGVCLVPVHTRGFGNCDLFFDKVFADDIKHVEDFKYFDKFRYIAEVADVVAGRKPGRENSKERILAYNVGIALHDIYFASKIYDLCGTDCCEISLDITSKKFWA